MAEGDKCCGETKQGRRWSEGVEAAILESSRERPPPNHIGQRLEGGRGVGVWISGGRAFQRKESTRAKALSQAPRISGVTRRLMR